MLTLDDIRKEQAFLLAREKDAEYQKKKLAIMVTTTPKQRLTANIGWT
jgi:hypothetical protein